MTYWIRNGLPEAGIAPDDRGLAYGDGLFETLAIRGGEPRLWHLHLDRLESGCARLGLPAPDPARLKQDLLAALAEAGVDHGFCTAKIIVTAGSGPRGYVRPPAVEPTVLIGIAASRPPERTVYAEGCIARLCRLRLALQPALAGLKTLNRLEQVLARAEWQGDAVAEGLLLDAEGRVICGTMSNVFLVTDNGIATPAITRCGISGVMRRHVIAVLAAGGRRVEVRDIDAGELDGVTELFFTNSHFGVLPVRRFDGRDMPARRVTNEVLGMVAQSGIAECRV